MEQNSRPNRVDHTDLSSSTPQRGQGNHSHPPIDPAFFDRVLDRIDPHGAPWDAGLWMIQIICGRWLAWRRIQQGLSIQQLSEQIDLDSRLLSRLEEGVGLEDADALHHRVRARLARRLAYEGAEMAHIEQVIGHALGLIVPPNELLVEGLSEELRGFEVASVTDQLPVVATSPVAEPRAVRLESDIFALLNQLMIRPCHSIDLADRLNKDSPTINGLLVRMLAEGLISKAETRIDPDLDDTIPLMYYRVTAYGTQAYMTEQQQQKAEQQLLPGFISAKPAPGY